MDKAYHKTNTIRECFDILEDRKKNLFKDPFPYIEDGEPKGWRTDYNVSYCKHGTNLGTPYGADYLCGYCEDGIEDDELRKRTFRLRTEDLLEQYRSLSYDLLRHLDDRDGDILDRRFIGGR